MALRSHLTLLSIAIVLIFLRIFPVVFEVIATVSAIFALITIFDNFKNLLPKYLLDRRICPENKAVLITGCDSGFGHLLAQRLDRLGFHVFAACLFPSGSGAQDLRNRASANLEILGLDVTDSNGILNALHFVESNLREDEVLWAVVNNAGIAHAGEIEWTSMPQIQKLFDVNTLGMVKVTKSFLPLLRKSKGRVVNTTSSCGRLCGPAYVAYCMSKAAAVAFTCGLRMEMFKFGVKVIGIEPYFYRTQINENKSILETIENAFNESPEDIKEAYGTEYLNAFKQVCLNTLSYSCTNLKQVIDCFEDAIVAEEPQTEYFPCDLPQKFVLKLYSLLPQHIVQTILRKWHLPSAAALQK